MSAIVVTFKQIDRAWEKARNGPRGLVSKEARAALKECGIDSCLHCHGLGTRQLTGGGSWSDVKCSYCGGSGWRVLEE